MFSSGAGHNDTTRLLIDSKADVNVIVKATIEYIEQVKKNIAAGKEDVEVHKDGVTALHVAAQGGHIGTVKMLIESGAVVRLSDDEDMTPLKNAIKGNHFSVAYYLVQHGADPDDIYIDEKKKKHNLLMDAVVSGNEKFALLLIEKNCNIEYTDIGGVSVITQAAHQGMFSVVEALLKRNADINVKNKEGITPLLAASSEGHHNIVRILLASINSGSSGSSSEKSSGSSGLSSEKGEKKGDINIKSDNNKSDNNNNNNNNKNNNNDKSNDNNKNKKNTNIKNNDNNNNNKYNNNDKIDE